MRRIRRVKDNLLTIVCVISSLFGIFMLFSIILQVFFQGLPSLTPYFILTPESETPGLGQGIANAIVGSILLSLLSTVIATPFALGTAVYLQKYALDNRITRGIRFFIEVLSGTPSIVVGAFGLLVLVIYLRPFTGGFSLIAGSIGLAILILPVIERSIEDAIAAVPSELEEGSYAMGATKWLTIRNITLPTAVSGIVTGIILGFGRAAEESAVVILTAGYSQFMPEFAIKQNEKLFMGVKIYPLQDLVGSLPYAVYHAYENANVIPKSNGFACAFILIVFVMGINLTAKGIFWYSTCTRRSSTPLFSSLARTLSGVNGAIFRGKPAPVPACAKAEAAAAGTTAAAKVTPSPATITPSPLPAPTRADWGRTLAEGLRIGPVPGGSPVSDDDLFEPPVPPAPASDGPHPGARREDPVPASRPEGLPVPLPPGDDLLEDEGESPSLSTVASGDTGLPGEPDWVLMEDPPAAPGTGTGEPPPAVPVPVEEGVGVALPVLPGMEPSGEAWRRMAKNRLENTIAGVTSDPWEWT